MKTYEIFGAFVNCTSDLIANYLRKFAEECAITLIEGRTYTAEVRQVWDEDYDGGVSSKFIALVIRDEYTKEEHVCKTW